MSGLDFLVLVLYGTYRAHDQRMKSVVRAEISQFEWPDRCRVRPSLFIAANSFFSKLELLSGGLVGLFECQYICLVESSQSAVLKSVCLMERM